MMVGYVSHVRKTIGVVCFISSASFVALNTEGSETCLTAYNCNVKLIQHWLIRFSCLKQGRIKHA